MQNTSLSRTCYVVGGGAFGVFVRWLQTQVAFNDDGLPDRSFWNIAVVLIILAAVYVFLRFVDRFKNERHFLPGEFTLALKNQGKLYTAARWACGGLMCLGAVVLAAQCETDREVTFYRILALLGLLTGAAFPYTLREANREQPRIKLVCALHVLPIVFFAFWLITCYKVNAINGVLWVYAPEIISVCILMLAFFQVAGFAYGSPDVWRAMFFCMFGAFLAIMCLADGRYMGQQLMLIAAAGMLVLYNWIMIANLQQKQAAPKVEVKDGFERL